jgi:hypothetical protein
MDLVIVAAALTDVLAFPFLLKSHFGVKSIFANGPQAFNQAINTYILCAGIGGAIVFWRIGRRLPTKSDAEPSSPP